MINMQYLPEELQEEVLFSLKEPEDLARACSVSRGNRQICSDRLFWREKFRRENLPLLEEGTDAASWLRIYRKSQRIAQDIDGRLNSASMIDISLGEIKDPDLLLPLSEADRVVPYWQSIQRVSFVNFRLQFRPSEIRGKYNYALLNNFAFGESGNLTAIATSIRHSLTGSVDAEDLWFILYNIAYYPVED
ncbi:F-box domain-containing protein [Cedratvirus Zaza IHUMI]|uniref:F-box domain-containing protein n=1 Tax=Cedratvirus Zaza IHUMI TaxID=2126979 RepID=A0A2R8FEC5_9VIRU|nr:F-box domain-containing protein [Cedratvirus Zaza IHUMI]